MHKFSAFVYPEIIVTNNGPQLIPTQFASFLKIRNIKHRKVLPYHAAGNGEVERFNETLGKFLQTRYANRSDWRKELDSFLLSYQTTPHLVTVPPPALLCKHTSRSNLPTTPKEKLEISRFKIKTLHTKPKWNNTLISSIMLGHIASKWEFQIGVSSLNHFTRLNHTRWPECITLVSPHPEEEKHTLDTHHASSPIIVTR